MTRRVLLWAGLAVLVALPRVARLLHPQVWIEDDSYLHGAFLLSQGRLPYRDFPLPHLPLLEAMMSTVFRIAPITIRTAEVVTQCAAFAGSLLVFAIGRRLRDDSTGVLAALIFATSDLLFRYHVFEREVFLVVPVLAAFLLLMRGREAGETGAAATAGALLACAVAIKLTAATAVVAVAIWLWLDGRRRSAIVVATTSVAIVAAVTAALAAWFGTDFIVQVIVFRLAHAAFPSLGVKVDEVRYSMDVSLACGVSGIVLIVWRGEASRWRGPLVQLACAFAGLVLFNPTYWAHTGIELLPWLSLCAGRLLASIGDLRSPAHRFAETTCVVTAILLMIFFAPIRNVNWQPGDDTIYGFGYRDRAELERAGAFVRSHSSRDAAVATPPLIAFIANRAEVVPYAEIAGTIDELTTAVRRDGYWRAIWSASDQSFWDSVEDSRDRMMPRLDTALAAHRVAVVIDDSPDDLLPIPLVNVTADEFKRTGYGLEWTSAHYEAWVPK